MRVKSTDRYSDVISNAMAYQITGVSIVCLALCSGTDKKKQQSSTPLAFMTPGNPMEQRARNAENIAIWLCHHSLPQHGKTKHEPSDSLHILHNLPFSAVIFAWSITRVLRHLESVETQIVSNSLKGKITAQRKHQSSAFLGHCENHFWLLKYPHQWPLRRKVFPCHDVIMILGYIYQKNCQQVLGRSPRTTSHMFDYNDITSVLGLKSLTTRANGDQWFPSQRANNVESIPISGRNYTC